MRFSSSMRPYKIPTPVGPHICGRKARENRIHLLNVDNAMPTLCAASTNVVIPIFRAFAQSFFHRIHRPERPEMQTFQ